MNDRKDMGQGAQSSGINLGDVYYILFRHKWKIIVLGTLGVLAAAVLYVRQKPVYGSEAELLVRYVVDTKVKVNGTDIRQLDPRGDNTLNSEVRIFTSFDLATNVVRAIGAETILGGPDPENDPITKAAKVIRQNVMVEPVRRTDVLRVVFQHPNKDLVQPILTQLINSYLDMHARIHNGLGVSETFLVQRTSQLSNQLVQTEAQLRQAKAAAGVVSTLEDAKKEHAEMISAQVRELNSTRADLAGHEAALRMFSKPIPIQETTNPAAVATTTELPAEAISEYKELDAQLQDLHATKRETLKWATAESYPVRDIEMQIKDTEQKKKALEAKYPRLASMPTLPAAAPATAGGPSAMPAFDPMNEEVQVRILTARIELMNSKLTQLRQELTKIEASEALITELQRKRDIEDTDYRFYESSLHQAKMTQTLEEGKYSNISVTQEPTPPYKDTDRTKKMCALVAGGGLGVGLALAVLLELFLNQTVRRPSEIETRLRLPLLLSIPDTSRRNFRIPGSKRSNGHALLKAPAEPNGATGETHSMEVALWDNSHDLRLYFEALRDRLFVFFDANNLKHHPKLVAVTACSEGAGVSTIAAGLAATLSETGDGNVLLVDMNNGEGAARPFYKGKPTCGIEDALEDKKRDGAMVQNNLYVVAEGMNGNPMANALPKQFTHLMPKLKTSDYDFIIFDLPPVSQISVTPKMARMMDINLLIVESEKTDREIVKQASSMISGSKSNLGVVLNKKRSYVPTWLQQEL